MIIVKVISEDGFYQRIFKGKKNKVLNDIYWFAIEIGETLYLYTLKGEI